MTIQLVALVLLVIALGAIFVWRALGHWTPPTDRQIHAAMESPEDLTVPGDFNGDGIPDSAKGETH